MSVWVAARAGTSRNYALGDVSCKITRGFNLDFQEISSFFSKLNISKSSSEVFSEGKT